VVTMVNFNYRRAPALAYARTLLHDGPLGRPHAYRGAFSQDVGSDLTRPAAWRLSAESAGAGSIATMGSHVLDMARFLVGDPTAVVGSFSTHVSDRPGPDGEPVPVDVDDSAAVLLTFGEEQLGSVYSSWMAPGRKHHFELEVNAANGSIAFNSERLNELQVCEGATGAFSTVYMGNEHPYYALLSLKAGMTLGLWDTVLFQVYDLAHAIARGEQVAPSFEDGYQVDRLIAAALESRDGKRWIAL
jgi:levoglucosan dehydrogenase